MTAAGRWWHRAWVRWLAVFLFWTLLALFFASQAGLTYLYQQGWAPWGLILRLQLSEWYIWAALTPAVVWLARRVPIGGGGWPRAVLIHIAAGVALTLLKIVIEGWLRRHLLHLPGVVNVANKFHLSFLAYWAIVLVTHGLALQRRSREREVRAAQLETQLAQAQLQTLQTQLQPHFLFNTLHSISALMHRDVDAADAMLARLSELLRLTLEQGGTQTVTLKKEMEFLESYLEIERTRFADRLTVATSVEPAARDALVPHLLLQPLVENAIRHGIAPRAAPGTVAISAAVSGGRVCLEVRDDGAGLAASWREGLGIGNTRARLERLYHGEARFEIAPAEGRGASVRISFPLRTS